MSPASEDMWLLQEQNRSPSLTVNWLLGNTIYRFLFVKRVHHPVRLCLKFIIIVCKTHVFESPQLLQAFRCLSLKEK